MKVTELLNEGTWSLPNTPDKVKTLKRAFDAPITPDGAEELYHILGDDDILDIVSSLRKKHGENFDVRAAIADRVSELLDTSTWNKQPDENTKLAARLLKKFLQKFTVSE